MSECPPSHKHGLALTCYEKHQCRCDACRAHKAEYARVWRAGNAVEPDPYAVELAVEGVPALLTHAQRAEAVHRLWARRWSDRAIAEQIGISERTVLRIRHRHGWRGYEKWEMQKMKEAA